MTNEEASWYLGYICGKYHSVDSEFKIMQEKVFDADVKDIPEYIRENLPRIRFKLESLIHSVDNLSHKESMSRK